MTKSHTISNVLACVAALAIAMPLGAQAATSTIFDTFDANEGHFDQWPGYSGSTFGITSVSTADRVTTSPVEGAGCEKLVLVTNGVASILVRFLSGLGTPANNTAFTTSSATDGWIGCFVKTTNTGWNVSLWLEGASVNVGLAKNITADGAWHVYEWNLEDTSGGADGWGSLAGIITGSPTVSDGSHTIDSIVLRNTSATVPTNVIYMDFVARYSDGSISNLVNQPCLGVPTVNISGPLSTNENIVRVTGVSSTATNITIYEGPNSSGAFTNLYSMTVSSPASTVNVTVPAGKLIKGAKVAATQTIAGQEACVPTTGVAVGGGASPSIRIAASIGQPTGGGVAGPVGRNYGSTGANMYWIHATGSAVAGGYTISPSTNWQTIAFYPTDSKYLWYGTFTFPDPNQYGIFESFGIASADATDSGPIQVYFDNLRQVTNGVEALIQNFEGNANGVNTVLFYQPSYSSTTGGGLLGYPSTAPNASVISSTVAGGYASTGTNSQGVNWQFASAGSSSWLRLCANGPNGNPATPFPVVDLTQPILVDVLLLPVGKTVAHPLGRLSPTNSFYQTNCPGTSASFAVKVTPPDNTSPTYTYTWKHGSTTVQTGSASTYTKTGLTAADAGTYSVTVSDGVTSATLTNCILTVPAPVQIDSFSGDPGSALQIGSYRELDVAASVPDLCPCGNNPALTYQWQRGGTNIPNATGTAFVLSSVALSDAGWYSVLVSNTCNGLTASTTNIQLAVYDPSVTVSNACGTGLLGLYWTNQTSANAFSGAPTWTNTDSTVNFDWVAAGPAYDIYSPANYFTIRWIGQFQAPYDGQDYTFYTKSDDGARLWVNGQLLVNKWVAQSGVEWGGTLTLSAAQPVDLILEYFEQTGNASVILSYSSEGIYKAVIPQAQLCAADPGTNIPPLVKLTSPANNATDTMPTPVTLTANVTQESAPVSKVEFYNNGTTLLATVVQTGSGNYSQSWTPPAAGVYNITARAYYNTSHTLNSPSNKLTVNVPQSAVTITNITATRIDYTGGAGSQFVLMATNSLVSPIMSRNGWQRLATNTVTPSSFTITPNSGAAFYYIKSE